MCFLCFLFFDIFLTWYDSLVGVVLPSEATLAFGLGWSSVRSCHTGGAADGGGFGETVQRIGRATTSGEKKVETGEKHGDVKVETELGFTCFFLHVYK